MSDNPAPVSDLLAARRVDEATPEFWARLEAELAAEPSPLPRLDIKPTSGHTRVLLLAAAAVVAIVAGTFALYSLLAGDGADDTTVITDTPPPPDTGEGEPAEATPEPTQAPTEESLGHTDPPDEEAAPPEPTIPPQAEVPVVPADLIDASPITVPAPEPWWNEPRGPGDPAWVSAWGDGFIAVLPTIVTDPDPRTDALELWVSSDGTNWERQGNLTPPGLDPDAPEHVDYFYAASHEGRLVLTSGTGLAITSDLENWEVIEFPDGPPPDLFRWSASLGADRWAIAFNNDTEPVTTTVMSARWGDEPELREFPGWIEAAAATDQGILVLTLDGDDGVHYRLWHSTDHKNWEPVPLPIDPTVRLGDPRGSYGLWPVQGGVVLGAGNRAFRADPTGSDWVEIQFPGLDDVWLEPRRWPSISTGTLAHPQLASLDGYRWLLTSEDGEIALSETTMIQRAGTNNLLYSMD